MAVAVENARARAVANWIVAQASLALIAKGSSKRERTSAAVAADPLMTARACTSSLVVACHVERVVRTRAVWSNGASAVTSRWVFEAWKTVAARYVIVDRGAFLALASKPIVATRACASCIVVA